MSMNANLISLPLISFSYNYEYVTFTITAIFTARHNLLCLRVGKNGLSAVLRGWFSTFHTCTFE